jgi:hypothetical protein
MGLAPGSIALTRSLPFSLRQSHIFGLIVCGFAARSKTAHNNS